MPKKCKHAQKNNFKVANDSFGKIGTDLHDSSAERQAVHPDVLLG